MKCLIVVSATLMHFEICLLGCTTPLVSFMTIREGDLHKLVLVHTMSSMQFEHFKRQQYTIYCWCIANLAISDTSTAKNLINTHRTANGKNKFCCEWCNIYSKTKLELPIKNFRQPNTCSLRTKTNFRDHID